MRRYLLDTGSMRTLSSDGETPIRVRRQFSFKEAESESACRPPESCWAEPIIAIHAAGTFQRSSRELPTFSCGLLIFPQPRSMGDSMPISGTGADHTTD